jgi:uncharacterized protein YgiM (DUF1202 family)
MKICTGLILILLTAPLLMTAQPAMAASFKLDVKDSKPFYQTNIPLEIYKQTHNSALNDLTITNAAGEQVPYALVPYRELHLGATQNVESKIVPFFPIKTSAMSNPNELRIQLEKNAGKTTVDIISSEVSASPNNAFLIDLGAKHPPLHELAVDWQGGENTLNNIEVLSSDDLKEWTFAGSATLLNTLPSSSQEEQLQQLKALSDPKGVDQNAKQNVTSNHTISQHKIQLDNNWNQARYLQIRPSQPNDKGTITLTEVRANYATLQTVALKPLWQETSNIGRENIDKTGLVNIDFESFGHFPTDRLIVKLPQINTRTDATVWVRNATNEPWRRIANVELNSIVGAYPDPDEHAIEPVDARFWRLQFDQSGGGIGADNPSLSLGWLQPTIVWNARGQAPFTLAVGETPSIVNTIPISTMIPNYTAQTINNLPVASLIIGNQDAQNMPAASTWVAPRDYKTWLLWGGLVLGVLLLAGMAYSLLKSERKD